jgi:hypothetical protein
VIVRVMQHLNFGAAPKLLSFAQRQYVDSGRLEQRDQRDRQWLVR